MNDSLFSQIGFGSLSEYLENDDVTDISYSNGGQLWVKTLSKGIYQVENKDINNAFMEKLAFQCANVMGRSFNMAHPFLDAEGAELRLNFVHESIAQNGIAAVIRKTPAKIRLVKEKLLAEHYIELDIHDFLLECVKGHCNIIVSGETGSGKTEFVKYLASHTKYDEKVITIEDTLELHLDKIYPGRDIVTMKTNNIASYSDVLVTCMRQNPKWILLSEVRSAEAVMAVRNSISSGHYILSTIHADKAVSIPNRMYSLLETNQDIEQFLKSIYRYIQIGVYIRGYQDNKTKHFHREIAEVTEFYVDEDNKAVYNTIYQKSTTGHIVKRPISQNLIEYLDAQGVVVDKDIIKAAEYQEKKEPQVVQTNVNLGGSTDSTLPRQNIQSSVENRTQPAQFGAKAVTVQVPGIINNQNQQPINNIQPSPNMTTSSINQIKEQPITTGIPGLVIPNVSNE